MISGYPYKYAWFDLRNLKTFSMVRRIVAWLSIIYFDNGFCHLCVHVIELFVYKFDRFVSVMQMFRAQLGARAFLTRFREPKIVTFKFSYDKSLKIITKFLSLLFLIFVFSWNS